jgi:hypothetical protein
MVAAPARVELRRFADDGCAAEQGRPCRVVVAKRAPEAAHNSSDPLAPDYLGRTGVPVEQWKREAVAHAWYGARTATSCVAWINTDAAQACLGQKGPRPTRLCRRGGGV